jgi:hypothetical protein
LEIEDQQYPSSNQRSVKCEADSGNWGAVKFLASIPLLAKKQAPFVMFIVFCSGHQAIKPKCGNIRPAIPSHLGCRNMVITILW